MKYILKLILFLQPLLLYENKAFSLPNYKIKEICQEYQRKYKCIRVLKSKREDLLQGNKIEVPVIPYRK